ncbi:MAG TPA: DUF3696 domain-containing protein [Desulfobacterales bacterium]|nr:MAG: hypothetical protein DRI57_14805 [Deltaproteobacteria bacterium]HHC25598.1 DUF3696 domain-containing protein [Desulfobacterales bacterium]
MNIITKLSVTGYKSVYETRTIKIAPLTLLAGANSSGKSSFLQPFLLLKQTLEAPFDPGPLLLHGENVKVTNINQMLSDLGSGKRHSEFSIGIGFKDGSEFSSLYEKSDKELKIKSQKFTDRQSDSVRLVPDMASQNIEKNIPEDLIISTGILKKARDDLQLCVIRNRCFLSVGLLSDSAHEKIFPLYSLGENVYSEVESIIHLPGLRGNPERTYKTSAVGILFPGRFENYVASIIYNWQSAGDSEKLKELGNSLQAMGLTWKVQAKKVDDSGVELLVGRLPGAEKSRVGDMVSIADFGFGVSQALPVAVALIAARKHQIVYLEQPEIHLHPGAQLTLAQLLAKAAKRGVIVIAETHSDLLLQGIQTLIAKGELSSEDTALHWFSRNEYGATEIHSAELDENGAFGEWPEDFDEIMLGAESDYLNAVENRMLSDDR